MTTTAVAERTIPVAATGDRFYVRMATACLAVAVVGFAPTYWVPMLRGTLDVHPLAHLHAAVFYGWLLLLIKQSSLASAGRLARHRSLGMLGVALATAMLFVGIGMAIDSIRALDAAGLGEQGRRFAIVPLTAAPFFAGMFALAVAKARNRELHNRLILVATISLLQAAVGRWFVLLLAPPRPAGLTGPLIPPPVAVTIMPGLVADLLIVVAMIHDRRTRGRIHPAYLIGGAAVVFLQVIRVPLSATTAWAHVVNWVMAVAP